MKRICSFLAVISLGLLAGCAAMFGENLPSTTVDSSFDKRIMRFTNSLGTPQPVAFYLKSYNQDGMIAVCGVAVQTGAGVIDQLVDLSVNEAFVALRTNSNRIVSARFIGQTQEKTRQKSPIA